MCPSMGGGSSAGDEELAFTCKVDNMEGRLPLVPSLLGIKEGLPVLSCVDIVLRGEDGCGGNGHKLDIGECWCHTALGGQGI